MGIRSTIGLTSRDGVIPLSFDRDIAGPMARSVEDAARIFNVVAGYDPADPYTEAGHPGPFVDGARAAYEMIVTAFALGDHQTLRNLLSDEVYDNFASAIEAREAASETLETTITTMKAADIVDAGLDGKIAEVTVKFVSDMISVSHDDDGEVIAGTSAEHEVTDIWTFGRDTGSRDPNWTLVATSSEN